MDNMLDLSREAFREDALSRLSSVLHETQSATRRGIDSALPASIAGLAEHTRRTRNAESLLGTFQAGNYPHLAPSEVRRLVDDPMRTAKVAASGEGFLARIFGSRLDDVVDLVARQAGISRTSAHILLGLSAPLVLDALSKEADLRHWDARALSRFLSEQEGRAAAALPYTVAGAVAATASVPRNGSGPRLYAAPPSAARRPATVTHLRDRWTERQTDAVEEQLRAQRAESTRRTVPLGAMWLIAAVVLFALITWLAVRFQPELPPPEPRPGDRFLEAPGK